VLDGDVLRQGLNAEQGFSAAYRAENVRRAARRGVPGGPMPMVALPFRPYTA
jgi:hypothetical protein